MADEVVDDPAVVADVGGDGAGGDDGAEAVARLGGLDGSAATKKKKKKKKKKGKGPADPSDGIDGVDAADDLADGDGGGSGAGSAMPGAAAAGGGTKEKVLAGLQQKSGDYARMLAARIQQLQSSAAAAPEDPLKKDYKFWKTQPVPQWNEDGAEKDGPLEADKPLSELRQEPLTLPAGFEWCSLDLNDPAMVDELYTLLNENYVEDDDNMFRFDYSREFLLWALKPPGWKQVWHTGVRTSKNQKLRGFISAVPATMRMLQTEKDLVEINFLCVHKKLRSHRLAPVLIREITRRVNCEGLFQAVYTAGVVLPKPIAKCRYWHRSLDPKKLIDVKFSYLPRNTTMAKLIRKLRVPSETITPGLRPMVPADVPAAWKLTVSYLNKFKVAPKFTSEEEYGHWLLPRAGVVNSYVVENPESKEITDVVSFYTLPSTIVNHPTHKLLKAAYSFYNVPATTPIKDLMQDALILAKQEKFDVFNALDLMQNSEFLEDLEFGKGDGNLQYYLYNYRLKEVESSEIGLVLL